MAAPPGAIEARRNGNRIGLPEQGKRAARREVLSPAQLWIPARDEKSGCRSRAQLNFRRHRARPCSASQQRWLSHCFGQARSRTRRRRGRACVRQVSRSSNRRGKIRKSESGGPRGRRTRDECSPRVATEKRPGNPGEGYGEALHRVGRGREPRLQKPIWPPVSPRRDSAPSPR